MDSIIPEGARIGLEVELRDRLDRLNSLTPEQRAEVLPRLAAYDGGTFDVILDDITGADGDEDLENCQKAEAYCLLCGDSLAAHDAGHEPFPAWRPRE